MEPKVFCIGFHKTGTTSMKAALQVLGYRVTGPNGQYDPDIAGTVLELAHSLVPKYDAFQDNPWPVIYREMDAAYPGSKFVLLLRETDSWIRSQVRHFGRNETPMRQWIYGAGCPLGNEEIYRQRFESHNREVVGYFQNRPDDLLVMNLAEGDGWPALCRFLDKPEPASPFPHTNRGASGPGGTAWARTLLRQIDDKIRARRR